MTEILAGKDGGSTPSQYWWPDSCKNLQDLVRYRGMKKNVAAVFKGCVHLAENEDEIVLIQTMIDCCEAELEEPSTEDAGFGFGMTDIPQGCKEIQDLIEYYDMNFALGNIFKACYRIGHCNHSSKERDLNKCIWFATRELRRRAHQ